MKKPKPVTDTAECSLCGEAWGSHLLNDEGEVDALECIRLLRAKTSAPIILWRERYWPNVQPWNPSYPTITTQQHSGGTSNPGGPLREIA